MQSFRATISVTPLRPLGTVTAGLSSIALLVSWRLSEAPDLLVTAAAGALAAGVVLGLDDEGFGLIRAVPTTALARLGLRLAVLVPVLIIVTGFLLVAGDLLFDERAEAPSLVALSGLVAAGVAVEVWWRRHRPEMAAEGAAAVVLAWSLSASIVPNAAALQAAANSWHTHSIVVIAVSVGAAVVGSRSRAA